MTGAGGSRLTTFDALSPPNGTPHLGKQQAVSSELRDNSLLQAGRAGPVAWGGHSWLDSPAGPAPQTPSTSLGMLPAVPMSFLDLLKI